MSELNDISTKQIIDDMRKDLAIVIKKSEEREKQLKSMTGEEIMHEIKNLVNEIKSGLMKEGVSLGHLDHILDKSGFITMTLQQPIFVLQAGPETWINQLIMWNKVETMPLEKASITIEINR